MGWCCARDPQKSLLKRYSKLCFITKKSLVTPATNNVLTISQCCQVVDCKRREEGCRWFRGKGGWMTQRPDSIDQVCGRG